MAQVITEPLAGPAMNGASPAVEPQELRVELAPSPPTRARSRHRRSVVNLPRWLAAREPLTLVAILAIVTMVPVVLLSTFSLSTMYSTTTEASNQRLQGDSALAAVYVHKEMASLTALADSYAGRSSMIAAVQDGKHVNFDSAVILSQLKEIRALLPAARLAGVVDATGDYWGDEDPATAPDLIGTNYSMRDWYQGVIKAGQAYVSSAFVSAVAGNPQLVMVATPIKADGRYAPAGTEVGILIIGYELSATQQLFSTFTQGQGVELEVTDQQGVIIAESGSTSTKLVHDKSEGVQAALRGASAVQRAPYRGQDYFNAFAPVPDIGWTVVTRAPASAVLGPADMLRDYLIATTVVLLAILAAIKVLVYFVLRDRQATTVALETANSTLERRVATRTAELEAANQELEAFAYSISHDLRAPLRAMSGFSNLLRQKESARLDADGQQYLQRIEANAAKMAQLIDELLKFSRLGRGDMKTAHVDPASLANVALADLRQQAIQAGVEVVISPMPACTADSGLLQQVYANLLSNAIKFSGGRPGALVEVGAHTESGETVYDVRDNGVGFDMRYADKLFGVFQRLHTQAEFEGTGIGLALVQRIILRHGGRVWAEAEVERGAAFHFTLKGD